MQLQRHRQNTAKHPDKRTLTLKLSNQPRLWQQLGAVQMWYAVHCSGSRIVRSGCELVHLITAYSERGARMRQLETHCTRDLPLSSLPCLDAQQQIRLVAGNCVDDARMTISLIPMMRIYPVSTPLICTTCMTCRSGAVEMHLFASDRCGLCLRLLIQKSYVAGHRRKNACSADRPGQLREEQHSQAAWQGPTAATQQQAQRIRDSCWYGHKLLCEPGCQHSNRRNGSSSHTGDSRGHRQGGGLTHQR